MLRSAQGIGYPEHKQPPEQLSLSMVWPPTYLLPLSTRVQYHTYSARRVHFIGIGLGKVQLLELMLLGFSETSFRSSQSLILTFL